MTSWVAKTNVTAHVLMIRRLMGYVASMYTHICTVSELHHEFMNMMCVVYIYICIASIYVRNYIYIHKKISLYPVCIRFIYIYITHNYVMALQMFLHLSGLNLP